MTLSLLHTTDLTLTRATGERVLHDISLRIAQGERVG